MPRHRKQHPHAQLHLPALMPDEACLLANIFQRAADAIWRAHGLEMAHFLGFLPEHQPPPPPAVPLSRSPGHRP